MIRRPGPGGPRPQTAPIEVDLTVDCDEEVDGPRWAGLLAAALAAEGVAPGAAVGLTFVAPTVMADLNQAHMGGTGPTDVLAFPIDGLAAEGSTGGVAVPGVVGDVVICPAVAWAGAEGHAGSADDELALLVVHGALHLLGHDHGEDDERVVMQGRERALLAAHHGPLAGDPWAVGPEDGP